MLTSARETGSCQVSSFLHGADNISRCFECDSSSNMCLGCSKEPSHRNGETVLLSTQDKCLLLRNQVICHLRILIWRSGYCCTGRRLARKIYVYFADGIINSSDVYAQLSSGTRDISVTSFPSHTSTSMRRRASKILDTLL